MKRRSNTAPGVLYSFVSVSKQKAKTPVIRFSMKSII